jgi:Xaa-Pro aminopeptidase
MSEVQTKLERIRSLLDAYQMDALWLRLASSFAWATGGKSSYINTASSNGLASLLITRDRRYVITNNIEKPRIGGEEGLEAEGWEFLAPEWYTGENPLAALVEGKKVAVDGSAPGMVDVSEPVARLRANLLPAEVERFRLLGRICGDAMNDAIRAVRPGMSERELAALLAFEAERRGAQAIVNLIATDERIFRYRHPLPSDKKLDRYAMLVMCGRKWGLVCSVTRLVHFGPLPDELRRKQEALAVVDATYIASTRPNTKLGDIVVQAQAAYAAGGFGGEWRLHHQGGPVGYEAREYLGVPGSEDEVRENQVYAWNPSITGTKMEDTVLIGAEENVVLTAIPEWPTIPVEIGGKVYERPAILVQD